MAKKIRIQRIAIAFSLALLLTALGFEISAAQTKVRPPQGIAPLFHIMHDRPGYREQFAGDLDRAGALGGWFWKTWKNIEPTQGRFDWNFFDQYLNSEGNKTTTLKNGQVVRKPIALSIALLADVRELGVPDWVYRGNKEAYKILPRYNNQPYTTFAEHQGTCPPDYRPPWEDAFFHLRFEEMVKAFAAKYDNDDRVNSIWIMTGLYGETVTSTYNKVDCAVKAEDKFQLCYLDYNVPAFSQWALSRDSQYTPHEGAMKIYRKYFKNKPLFIINSGQAARYELTAEALTYSPPVGIKFNALEYDLPNQNTSQGDQWPSLTYYWREADQKNLEGMLGYEHFFPANPTGTYWALLTGLSRRMTLIDLPIDEGPNSKFLVTIAQMQKAAEQATITRENSGDYFPLWKFTEDHLGRNWRNTPSVWIVLRETEYRLPKYTSKYTRGEPGDYEFFLHRPENIEGQEVLQDRPQAKTVAVSTKDLAEAARSQIIGRGGSAYVRRTDQANRNFYMYFRVDARWPAVETAGFDIEITYLDTGRDTFSLKYGPSAGQEIVVPKKGTNKFIRETFSLTDLSLKHTINEWGDQFRIDCRADGDEYIHMVRVIPKHWQAPLWNFGGDPPPSAPTGFQIQIAP